MVYVDFFDFILNIIGNIPGLIITLGLLLFIISFVKITGKVEISDPEDCRKCRVIGAILLLVGILVVAYPDTIKVHGTIKYGIGKPAEGVRVAIGDFNTTTDGNGYYELPNIPRSKNFINIIFPKYEKNERISILPYSIHSSKMDIEGKIIDCTIEGNVIDEFGNKIKNVNVYFGTTICVPASDGHYKAPNVPISPTIPTFITVKDKDDVNLLTLEIETLSYIETTRTYKNYDISINLNKTLDVIGTIREYHKQNDQISDVIGAEIEMGGRLNITEGNGNYLITKVPRSAVKYNVTLINEKNVTGIIKPPLSYTLPPTKMARRNLIICV